MLPYWLLPELQKLRWKKVRDPIYTYVYFNEIERAVIDHPLTQRLRYIYQLQLARLVYPSAEHSRFQHSLGVMHVMGIISSKVLSKLLEEQELKSQEYATLVLASRIAGLLHDIGHIFLSHWAEEYLLWEGISYRSHEDLGKKLYEKFYIEYLRKYLNSSNLKEIIDTELLLRAIDALLTPLEEPISMNKIMQIAQSSLEDYGSQYAKYLVPLIQALRGWLYTADELDYLMRDGTSVGALEYGAIDWLRMLEETEVHRLHDKYYVLCVRNWRKFSPAFLKYLDSYLSLYRYCYLHKSTKAFELVLGKIIESDVKYFRTLLESLKNAIEISTDVFETYYKLLEFTDAIQLYKIIEYFTKTKAGVREIEKEWIKKFIAREPPLRCIFEAYIWCQDYGGFKNLKNIIKDLKEIKGKKGDVGLLDKLTSLAQIFISEEKRNILWKEVQDGRVLFGEIGFVRPKILAYDEKEQLIIERQAEKAIWTLKFIDFCNEYLIQSLGGLPCFAKILVFVDDQFKKENIPFIQDAMKTLIKGLTNAYKGLREELFFI